MPTLTAACRDTSKSNDISARVTVRKTKTTAGRIGAYPTLVVITIVPRASAIGGLKDHTVDRGSCDIDYITRRILRISGY